MSMKKTTTIYYFSGTGNSLSIAKDLGKKLGKPQLISMIHLLKREKEIFISGDSIGFVFPVYFGRVPVLVEEFLKSACFGKINYLFAVTNGGGAFCRTLKIFDRLLQPKKVSLNSGFTLGMPGVHPKVNQFIKKSNEEFFAQKERRINEITPIIEQRIDQNLETNFGFIGFLLSHLLFLKPYRDSQKHLLGKAIWINDKCQSCGFCVKICPVNNISITEQGPLRQGKCINCARCYHFCPHEAIELGDDTMKRYRNPHIKLQELIG